jgi:hypothetical protein
LPTRRVQVGPDAAGPDQVEHLAMPTSTEANIDDVLGTTDDELREQALTRLKKRRDLKAHAVVYALVNLAVWGLWVVVAANSGSWWPWPIFLTLFWGIGLAMNAWDVYFRKPITVQELQREMGHLSGHAGSPPGARPAP